MIFLQIIDFLVGCAVNMLWQILYKLFVLLVELDWKLDWFIFQHFSQTQYQSQIRFSWKIPQWNCSLLNLKNFYLGGVLHEDYNDVDDNFEDRDRSWKILMFPIFMINLQSLLSASSSIAFHSILSQFIFKSDFCILGSCYCNNLLLPFLSQGDFGHFWKTRLYTFSTFPPPVMLPMMFPIMFSMMFSMMFSLMFSMIFAMMFAQMAGDPVSSQRIYAFP